LYFYCVFAKFSRFAGHRAAYASWVGSVGLGLARGGQKQPGFAVRAGKPAQGIWPHRAGVCSISSCEKSFPPPTRQGLKFLLKLVSLQFPEKLYGQKQANSLGVLNWPPTRKKHPGYGSSP